TSLSDGRDGPIESSEDWEWLRECVLGCHAYEPPDLNDRLLHAVRHGKLDAVHSALAAGADPNTQDESGDTPLADAALHRDHEIAQALIAAGADLNHRGSRGGWRALAFAALEGDAAMVALL